MLPDFLNAFERHFKDAETLFSGSRWANAYQLYGYSAECGLKCIMQKVFGMQLDASTGKPVQRQDRVHLPDTLISYETYRAGAGATQYLLPPANPFVNWNINNRYVHDSNFDQVFVNSYKNGIPNVMTLIVQAMEDGFIS